MTLPLRNTRSLESTVQEGKVVFSYSNMICIITYSMCKNVFSPVVFLLEVSLKSTLGFHLIWTYTLFMMDNCHKLQFYSQ